MTDTVADHVMSWDLLVLRCEQEARCWDAWCADDGRPSSALHAMRAYQAEQTPTTLAAIKCALVDLADARRMAAAAWRADRRRQNPAGLARHYADTLDRLILCQLCALHPELRKSPNLAEVYRAEAQQTFTAAMIMRSLHPEVRERRP